MPDDKLLKQVAFGIVEKTKARREMDR